MHKFYKLWESYATLVNWKTILFCFCKNTKRHIFRFWFISFLMKSYWTCLCKIFYIIGKELENGDLAYRLHTTCAEHLLCSVNWQWFLFVLKKIYSFLWLPNRFIFDVLSVVKKISSYSRLCSVNFSVFYSFLQLFGNFSKPLIICLSTGLGNWRFRKYFLLFFANHFAKRSKHFTLNSPESLYYQRLGNFF